MIEKPALPPLSILIGRIGGYGCARSPFGFKLLMRCGRDETMGRMPVSSVATMNSSSRGIGYKGRLTLLGTCKAGLYVPADKP